MSLHVLKPDAKKEIADKIRAANCQTTETKKDWAGNFAYMPDQEKHNYNNLEKGRANSSL